MATRRPKRPRDPNQLDKLIVDLSTGEAQEASPPSETLATEFARSGGLKGGNAGSEVNSRTTARDSSAGSQEALEIRATPIPSMSQPALPSAKI
jgi:hypothetical protein